MSRLLKKMSFSSFFENVFFKFYKEYVRKLTSDFHQIKANVIYEFSCVLCCCICFLKFQYFLYLFNIIFFLSLSFHFSPFLFLPFFFLSVSVHLVDGTDKKLKVAFQNFPLFLISHLYLHSNTDLFLFLKMIENVQNIFNHKIIFSSFKKN